MFLWFVPPGKCRTFAAIFPSWIPMSVECPAACHWNVDSLEQHWGYVPSGKFHHMEKSPLWIGRSSANGHSFHNFRTSNLLDIAQHPQSCPLAPLPTLSQPHHDEGSDAMMWDAFFRTFPQQQGIHSPNNEIYPYWALLGEKHHMISYVTSPFLTMADSRFGHGVTVTSICPDCISLLSKLWSYAVFGSVYSNTWAASHKLKKKKNLLGRMSISIIQRRFYPVFSNRTKVPNHHSACLCDWLMECSKSLELTPAESSAVDVSCIPLSTWFPQPQSNPEVVKIINRLTQLN